MWPIHQRLFPVKKRKRKMKPPTVLSGHVYTHQSSSSRPVKTNVVYINSVLAIALALQILFTHSVHTEPLNQDTRAEAYHENNELQPPTNPTDRPSTSSTNKYESVTLPATSELARIITDSSKSLKTDGTLNARDSREAVDVPPAAIAARIESSKREDDNVFVPTLIGFRCDSPSEMTATGVSVIEANRPVKLTLYGEYFTSDIIVAFTTEFDPDSAYLAELQEPAHLRVIPPNRATNTVGEGLGGIVTVLSTPSNGPVESVEAIEMVTRPAESSRAEPQEKPRRMLNRRSAHDCTDYNRVVSYRLSEENILSPSVAVLTINLPELESGASEGAYYYFCIKQPRLSGLDRRGASLDSAGASSNRLDRSLNKTQLHWVHQGDNWWVMLKVEPPILSVTNDCFLILILLALSAVTSGLNLGLMSLDMNELAVISSCGDPQERAYARTIAPLRRRGNYLLCSLLLGNVMVNSTLTVILEEMTSGLVAVIGSTLAIVVLGEIVPQALCARQGLAIGAKTIYLTYAFMLVTFPLSYPISCLLDCVLGEEKGNVYDRERLMEFIRITGHHTQLESDEVAIISGALKLKKIKVDQIMTRIEDVFMLPIDCKLDRDTIKRIIEKGYSRIPVYEFGDRKQIIALILAKDLALIDPDDHTPIASMLMYCKHPLIFIEGDATLDVALNEFKTGKSHMAVVRQIYDDGETDKYYEAIGVVTLEDVIEEVLQTEINDETDTLSDNRRKRRLANAQVAHLFDELALHQTTARSLASTPRLAESSSTGFCDLASTACQVQPSLAKQQQPLSSQLCVVPIAEVAQSLARGQQQQPQAQPQQPAGVDKSSDKSSEPAAPGSGQLSRPPPPHTT